MPPVDHLPKGGPCGLTREPGATLLPARRRGAFFLTNFRGPRASPVIAFGLEPRGNGFRMPEHEEFLNGIIPTDVEFGRDGRLYVADMVAWELAAGGGRRAGRGAIFALSAEVGPSLTAEVARMRAWFAEGFVTQAQAFLIDLLSHADYRVRLEAQLALAARDTAVPALLRVALARGDLRARVHALQAWGQTQRRGGRCLERALGLFTDRDPEMRAQASGRPDLRRLRCRARREGTFRRFPVDHPLRHRTPRLLACAGQRPHLRRQEISASAGPLPGSKLQIRIDGPPVRDSVARPR